MSSPQAPEMLQTTPADTFHSTSGTATAGQLLKATRQAKGMDLALLALMLKVPVQLLEALEADRYEAFKSGTTFLRAVAASMCRHLEIDAAPVLALLPLPVSSMGQARPALEPLTGLQRIGLRPRGGRGARTVLVLAILMVLGTAAFLWLPSPELWWPGALTHDPAHASEEMAVPLGQASNPESSDEAASEASAAVPVAASAASAPASNAVTSAAPGASPASAEAPVASAAPMPTSVAILRLDALANTWVEVRDAQGGVVRKRLKSSESLEIQQAPPYTVVIGRASAVRATLRGKPLDFKVRHPQSEARFEVKP